MITAKKYVMTTALAALMLAGTVHEWASPNPVGTYDLAIPTARIDSIGGDDGSICFDTKFFLPFRSDERPSADHERRETLHDLLSTYEHQ